MKLIRAEELRQGRWRNGLGISWDVATCPQDETEFGWRLAIARIDGDVPFSHYANVDRIFTLIDGVGLDLIFEDGRNLAVDRLFEPHAYACDVATLCRLRDGPCRALNLFVRRDAWKAAVEIRSGRVAVSHHGPILVHALDGSVSINAIRLSKGDTLQADGALELNAGAAKAYVAKLTPVVVGGEVQSSYETASQDGKAKL